MDDVYDNSEGDSSSLDVIDASQYDIPIDDSSELFEETDLHFTDIFEDQVDTSDQSIPIGQSGEDATQVDTSNGPHVSIGTELGNAMYIESGAESPERTIYNDLPERDDESSHLPLSKAMDDISSSDNDDIDDEIETLDINDVQTADFQLETHAQIADAVERLRQVPEIQQEHWDASDNVSRLDTLQNVETTMAEIQGREQVDIVAEEMGNSCFGGFDGHQIRINANHLDGSIPSSEMVDTIIHEGRHAYQYAVVDNPSMLDDQEVVRTWEENLKPENYIDYRKDPEGYRNQPVESDAWEYARSIRMQVFGGK